MNIKDVHLKYVRIMLNELDEHKPSSLITFGKNTEHAKFMKFLIKDCQTKRKQFYNNFIKNHNFGNIYYGWSVSKEINTFIVFAKWFWNEVYR